VIAACIDVIDESAWQPISYPDGGVGQVAETIYMTGITGKKRSVRLVVRRTRLNDPAQQALWPDWRHHAFITDLDRATTPRASSLSPAPSTHTCSHFQDNSSTEVVGSSGASQNDGHGHGPSPVPSTESACCRRPTDLHRRIGVAADDPRR
jgi:hypothetical protein